MRQRLTTLTGPGMFVLWLPYRWRGRNVGGRGASGFADSGLRGQKAAGGFAKGPLAPGPAPLPLRRARAAPAPGRPMSPLSAAVDDAGPGESWRVRRPRPRTQTGRAVPPAVEGSGDRRMFAAWLFWCCRFCPVSRYEAAARRSGARPPDSRNRRGRPSVELCEVGIATSGAPCCAQS